MTYIYRDTARVDGREARKRGTERERESARERERDWWESKRDERKRARIHIYKCFCVL